MISKLSIEAPNSAAQFRLFLSVFRDIYRLLYALQIEVQRHDYVDDQATYSRVLEPSEIPITNEGFQAN